MLRSPSPLTSRRSASSEEKVLFFLSGEETEIPVVEAKALTRMQDPDASFSRPERRVLIASTVARPAEIETRIAYSRRVGPLISDDGLDESSLQRLRRGTYAIRVFDLRNEGDSQRLVDELAERIDGRVALDEPDAELTVVRGEKKDYFSVTAPTLMRQNWVIRRPRARAFFHPSAIFPKFSRLLVNLSGVSPGESFLDPFCGTGSLLLEAAEIGARPIGVDLHTKMVVGAIRNQRKFSQEWLGVIRGDSRRMPLSRADAVATDIPYGRVSTTAGSTTRKILESLINEAAMLLSGGRRLVVMHPESIEVPAGQKEFEVEEQIRVPVHKKLTRVVTVLRRP